MCRSTSSHLTKNKNKTQTQPNHRADLPTPQGNERSCNVHSTLVGEPKRDRLTCVATFASVNKFRLASVASLNFMDVHWTFANASWTFTTS